MMEDMGWGLGAWQIYSRVPSPDLRDQGKLLGDGDAPSEMWRMSKNGLQKKVGGESIFAKAAQSSPGVREETCAFEHPRC